MIKSDKRWWHVIISTHRSWLPGDRRGFRSKEHQIHSSGDYKKPPPVSEHEGLRRYHKERHPNAVKISKDQRAIVGAAIAEFLTSMGFVVWVVSVSATHAHIVAELPAELREFTEVLGKAKKFSSRQLKKILPGQVWARGDKHILLRGNSHRDNAFLYVQDDQGPSAAVWSIEGWTRGAEID